MSKAEHRMVTSDREIDDALKRARSFAAHERVAVEAKYEAAADLIAISLNDGVMVSIPRKYLQGLTAATRAQLSDIEIVGRGTGLHWPQLDVDHYVPGLLNSIFGTRRWLAEMGHKGGLSTSDAKKRAARANGSRGGRPPKNAKGKALPAKRAPANRGRTA